PISQFMTQGSDNAPPSRQSARSHDHGAEHFDPEMNFEFLRVKEMQPRLASWRGCRHGCISFTRQNSKFISGSKCSAPWSWLQALWREGGALSEPWVINWEIG